MCSTRHTAVATGRTYLRNLAYLTRTQPACLYGMCSSCFAPFRHFSSCLPGCNAIHARSVGVFRVAQLPSSKSTQTSPLAPTLLTVPAYGATSSE